MKKLWLFLVPLLGLSNGLAMAQGCSTVIISGPPSAAPSSWVQEGKLIGAAVEYTQTVALAAGVKNVEVRQYATWSATLAAAYTGEIDVVFSANWSEERDRYLNYVRPAMSVQFLNILVRRGEAFDLLKLDDLLGRRGGAAAGDTFGSGFFGTFAQEKLKLQTASNIKEAVDLLLEKKVDYIFGWENAVYEQLLVRNLGTQLEVLDTYPTRAEGFIAFSKRSKCGEAVRLQFADQVSLLNSKHLYKNLLKKYRETFNENLTRPK